MLFRNGKRYLKTNTLPKQQPIKLKYQIIASLKTKYPIGILCEYLNCSRSGYYDWVKRGLPAHNKLDDNKKEAILAVYNQKPTRGRRQVQMQLKRQFNLHMSLGSVHRYMSILCLRSKRKRQYKLLPKGNNPNIIYNNELNQNFKRRMNKMYC